jgi:hypothetical protein
MNLETALTVGIDKHFPAASPVSNDLNKLFNYHISSFSQICHRKVIYYSLMEHTAVSTGTWSQVMTRKIM